MFNRLGQFPCSEEFGYGSLVLSHMNSVKAVQPSLFEIHFNIILSSTFGSPKQFSN
jgi:hypothetical protein